MISCAVSVVHEQGEQTWVAKHPCLRPCKHLKYSVFSLPLLTPASTVQYTHFSIRSILPSTPILKSTDHNKECCAGSNALTGLCKSYTIYHHVRYMYFCTHAGNVNNVVHCGVLRSKLLLGRQILHGFRVQTKKCLFTG